MTWLDAILLGTVEGLTEFLPVSSTGHLILLNEWLGLNDDGAKTVAVVIQLGAILAVVVYFRDRLRKLVEGALRRDPESLRLGGALAIAFAPAAAVGLLVHKTIKERLFGPTPVAFALVAGGLLMLVVEALRRRNRTVGVDGLEKVTFGRALAIGVAQCASLWPGASRSMTTIVAGQLSGLSTSTAAEFSFLLAIPILGAATVFDLVKERKQLLAEPGSAGTLGLAMLVSFVVALLVIAGFLRYLKRVGLAPFGVYRVLVGGLMLYKAFGPGVARPADADAHAAQPAGDVRKAAAPQPE